MTDNLDWINEDDAVEILPPTIQWRRGDLMNQNPLLANGCWQFQAEEFTPFFPNLQPVDVQHSGGAVVPSYLLATINIAVLVWKKRWFFQDGEGNIQYLTDYEDGAKSRLQIWAVVKELGNEVAMISVRGMNAKFLGDAIHHDLVRKIIIPMHRHYRQRFARYHFWLPLATMGKVDVAQNQYVTPPGCQVNNFNIDHLKTMLVGPEVAKICQANMQDAKAWLERVSAPAIPQPETNGVIYDRAENGPKEGDEEFPF